MLYYALLFLIVGPVAGALGLFGVAAGASQIACQPLYPAPAAPPAAQR